MADAIGHLWPPEMGFELDHGNIQRNMITPYITVKLAPYMSVFWWDPLSASLLVNPTGLGTRSAQWKKRCPTARLLGQNQQKLPFWQVCWGYTWQNVAIKSEDVPCQIVQRGPIPPQKKNLATFQLSNFVPPFRLHMSAVSFLVTKKYMFFVHLQLLHILRRRQTMTTQSALRPISDPIS